MDYTPFAKEPEYEEIARVLGGNLDLANAYGEILTIRGIGIANREIQVRHSLQITPVYWIQLDRTSDAILYRTRAFTSDHCFFAFHNTTIEVAKVFVFPERV